MTQKKDLQYHIKIAKGDIGRYVFMPGDPGRVEKIAQWLDEPRFLKSNREYTTWVGKLDGVDVAVMSTGIGGPSAAIAVEEARACGADTFIRIGTCGLLQEHPSGTLVIPTGMIRGSGTASAYVPMEYPAVADPNMVMALKAAAEEANTPAILGIAHSKDAFFIEDAHRLPRKAALEEEWEIWRRAGVLATEMESDTLFVLGSIYNLRVGTLLLGISGLAGDQSLVVPKDQMDKAIKVTIEGMRRVIAADA